MSSEDEKILEKLKANKIDKLEEKLDHNIRGYFIIKTIIKLI